MKFVITFTDVIIQRGASLRCKIASQKNNLIRKIFNFKTYDVITWLTNNYNTITTITISQEAKTMKFDQFIKYNKQENYTSSKIVQKMKQVD